MPRGEKLNATLETLICGNLFVWITLPMALCQPPTELLFDGDNRRRDLVARLFKFPLQGCSWS
jgi:hypothetical protein